MEITHREEGGVTIVAMDGQLDATTVPEAEKAINVILEKGSNRLLFDLEKLEYLSSAGLRILLKAIKEIEQKRGKMVLCALNDYVQEVFEISGFIKLIPIEKTVASGLAAFG